MSEIVAIAHDGAPRARAALEGCLRAGGVALFPADTLYGLACDPLDAAAAERINAIKGRPEGKPSAVLYLSPLPMRELVAGLGPRAREAIGALLPGPVTVVVANPEHRYPLACGEDPERLGVRLIGGPLAGLATPLLQTSANRSSEPAPSRFVEIDPAIVGAVDLAIDGGELGGEPSTVLDLSRIDTGEGWRLLREGAVAAAEVERVLGEPAAGPPPDR